MSKITVTYFFLLGCILMSCASADEKLNDMVRQENSTYPLMQKNEVMIDSLVLQPNRTLCYYYTVTLASIESFTEESLKAEAYASKRSMIKKLRSGTSEFEKYKDFEVTFRCVYQDKNGNTLSDIEILPGDYIQIK